MLEIKLRVANLSSKQNLKRIKSHHLADRLRCFLLPDSRHCCSKTWCYCCGLRLAKVNKHWAASACSQQFLVCSSLARTFSLPHFTVQCVSAGPRGGQETEFGKLPYLEISANVHGASGGAAGSKSIRVQSAHIAARLTGGAVWAHSSAPTEVPQAGIAARCKGGIPRAQGP